MKDFVTLMKYRDGELMEDEKNQLEELIKKDKEISEMMEFLDELDEAICDEHTDEFEKKVNKLIEAYKKTKKENHSTGYSKIRKLKKYYIAASLLFFAILGTVLVFVNKFDNPDKLFSRYYTSYVADVITRSHDLDMEPDLDMAFQYYNNQQYPEAIASFAKLAESEKYDVVSHFHLGMSYLELGMYQKASFNLLDVLDNKENIYTHSAKWYLSLCFIKQNKNNEAKKLLNELKSIDYYSKDASELLKSLP